MEKNEFEVIVMNQEDEGEMLALVGAKHEELAAMEEKRDECEGMMEMNRMEDVRTWKKG